MIKIREHNIHLAICHLDRIGQLLQVAFPPCSGIISNFEIWIRNLCILVHTGNETGQFLEKCVNVNKILNRSDIGIIRETVLLYLLQGPAVQVPDQIQILFG